MELETPTLAPPNPADTLSTHFTKADQLHRDGRFHESAEELRRALAIDPRSPEGHFNLANVVRDAGEPALAVEGYKMAIACAKAKRHVYPDALINLGDALNRLGQHEEALKYLREARRLQPARIQAHVGTAFTLEAQGKLPAAIEVLQKATSLMPDNPALFTHLGSVRHWYGDYDGALAAFDRAIALKADYAEAHVDRGRTLLTLGRLQEGFAEAEWRWRVPAIASRRPKFATPEWTGAEPLQNKTILVYGSPLYAETIQFARYLPTLAALGARVVAMVDPALRTLVQSVEGVRGAASLTDAPPLHDYNVSLLSLPHLLNGRLKDLPGQRPYLSPVPAIAQGWETQLHGEDGFRIGVAWIAGQNLPFLRGRPLTTQALSILGTYRANTRLIALQQTSPRQPPEYGIAMPGLLPDFAQAAGLIACMDLVVTVDAPVAHLAAAMGKPTWLLLPTVAEWQWGLAGETSPWYPTMRIFRQSRKNNWAEVVKRVGKALAASR
jgi:Tfp pilus assembly protein PilF